MQLGWTLPLMAGLAAAAPALAAPGTQIEAYRWKSRLLVVVAPEAGNPGLARQREIYRGSSSGSRERDLVLIEGVGADGTALRRRFEIPDAAFRAILVGKDGGAKLVSGEPIAAETLFATIDEMPMRQGEIRSGRASR